MKRIYLEDIDLSELQPITNTSHCESTLFHDDTTAIKLFDDIDDEKRSRKQRKIELLGDGTPLPITIMPTIELFYEFPFERFEGFGMDFINSQTLYQIYNGNKDLDMLYRVLDTVSRSLMEIHRDPRKIVISDLHAKNIIIDRDSNPHIVDIDSCKIDGIKNDAIPLDLKYYLSNGKLSEPVDTTHNTDRFCLLIMMLRLIFNKSLGKITMHEYDQKSERIVALKNTRELVIKLQQSSSMPEVPYLHEMITSSGDKKRELKKEYIHK